MGLFGKKKELTSAQTMIESVCKVKKGENVLIIANPETNVIAQELFSASVDVGANPSLIFQQKKTLLDSAEKPVIGAMKSEPDVIFSVSAGKLGKDSAGIAEPYRTEDGRSFDNIFDYLLDGKKCTRAVWTPGITTDMYDRTVNIDYKLLGERCKKMCARFENAVSLHVTSSNGTDIKVPVKGRKPLVDNGDFSQPGSGGNIPSGEVFISPVVGSGTGAKANIAEIVAGAVEKVSGTIVGKGDDQNCGGNEKSMAQETSGCEGLIVFDGSIAVGSGTLLIKEPVRAKVEAGFVTEITGGEEASRLLKDIQAAEKEALALENSGKLPKGMGAVYSRNARNIGELGIGLNPEANITGVMLEDEKAFRTCHFAIGQNYDGDAPALIHFDGLVRNPTIVVTYEDGSEFTLLDKGDLKI